MNSWTTCLLAACTALAVAPAVLGQAPRDRAFGKVRDQDGKPWAGATVQFVHRAWPGAMAPAYQDLVTATTDARGEFRSSLLAGMPYDVFAHGPVEKGSYRCTALLQDAVARTPMLLHEGELRFVRDVELQADPSWTEPIAVVAWMRVGARQWRQRLVADEQGRLRTPLWPAELVQVSLLATSGGFASDVLTTWVCTSEARLRQSGSGRGSPRPSADADLRSIAGEPHRLQLGPRTRHVVRFVDADGKPVEGVEVRAGGSTPRLVLGRSDRDGKVHIATATEGLKGARKFLGFTDRDGMVHMATASDGPSCIPPKSIVLPQGHAEASLGRSAFQETAGPKAAEQETADGGSATVTLSAGRSVTGRLLLGEGQSLAQAPLVLQASIDVGARSPMAWVGPRVFRTDADGRFRIPGRGTGFPFRLSLVLSTAQRAALTDDQDAPPIWPLALVVPEQGSQADDLGDIRVDRLRALDVTVLAPDGTPPGSVQLFVAPLVQQPGRNEPQQPEVVRTDRRGRVRLLTAPCDRLLVHATTPRGAAYAVVTADQRQVDLRIDARHVVTFAVYDQQGKPLQGAGASLADIDGAQGLSDVQRMVFPCIRGWCRMFLFPNMNGRADERGRVELVMPMLDVQLDLTVQKRDRRIMRRVNVPFPSDRDRDRNRDREPEPIRIDIAPPR